MFDSSVNFINAILSLVFSLLQILDFYEFLDERKGIFFTNIEKVNLSVKFILFANAP